MERALILEEFRVNKMLKNVILMDTPKHKKQIPFERIYTESLTINWVISSQYIIFLCRQIDLALGSMMRIS